MSTEGLERDALNVTMMTDGSKVYLLPNDHPLMVERREKYEAEAQAERDRHRIDPNHIIAGDIVDGTVYLDGQPVEKWNQVYLGNPGWIIVFVRDERGKVVFENDQPIMKGLWGRVEVRK